MESPLLEIAKALVKHLDEAGVEVTPDMDIAVEACRTALRKGAAEFMKLAEHTFTNRIKPRSRANRVFREFREEIKTWVAEIVLTEREV